MMNEIISEVQEELCELNEYYEANIKGHTADEVPEKWEHYSEWYKELFGSRPVPVELRQHIA